MSYISVVNLALGALLFAQAAIFHFIPTWLRALLIACGTLNFVVALR